MPQGCPRVLEVAGINLNLCSFNDVVVVASVRALFPNCSQNGKNNVLRGTDLFPKQSDWKLSSNVIALADLSSI